MSACGHGDMLDGMATKRNVRLSYCHLLRLRACRQGYRNVRDGLGESNRNVRRSFEGGDGVNEADWSEWQRQWLGRCNFWRARLRWAVRATEDAFGRPHRA